MKNLFRLFAAALLLWAGTSLAQGYRVVDVMPDYWKFDAQAQGLDENARLQLFRELVVQRHPELYNARVIGLPDDKPFDQELARRFARVNRMTEGKAPLMRKLSDSIAADL